MIKRLLLVLALVALPGVASAQQPFTVYFGTAPADTNSGSKSAQTLRVVEATDALALPARGQGATAAAVPAGAQYVGANAGGNLVGIIGCDHYSKLDMTTATTTEIVAAVSSKIIYVCSFSVLTNGTTIGTFKYGTGSNCGTGTFALGPAWEFTAQTGIARGSGLGMVMLTPSVSQALCFTNSANVNTHIEVTWTQF